MAPEPDYTELAAKSRAAQGLEPTVTDPAALAKAAALASPSPDDATPPVAGAREPAPVASEHGRGRAPSSPAA